ncbi:hypothetical protein ACLOJK_010997 [Asimina triloba]
MLRLATIFVSFVFPPSALEAIPGSNVIVSNWDLVACCDDGVCRNDWLLVSAGEERNMEDASNNVRLQGTFAAFTNTLTTCGMDTR